MITRDYIMRQVHQLARVLAVMLFKKKAGELDEIPGVLNEGLTEAFGLKLPDFYSMDKDAIIKTCTSGDHFQSSLAVALADLLKEEGSLAGSERAFWLYEAVYEAGETLPLHALEWIRTQAS